MAYSWTYGGVRAETLFLNTTHVRRDIMPPINARTIPIPGRTGAQFFKTDFDMRTIDIDVYINGSTMIQSETYVRDIADFLDPTAGLKALVFDDNPNLTYYAVVSGNTDISQILELKRGTVTFLVPDAFAYAAAYLSFPFNPLELSRNSVATTQHGADRAGSFSIYDFDMGGHNPTYSILSNTNIEQIDGYVPRYFYDSVDQYPLSDTQINGVLVEEGTTNLIADGAAWGTSHTFYTAIGSVLSSSIGNGAIQSAKYNPQQAGTTCDLNGAANEEGCYRDVSCSASTQYTFSACVMFEGVDPANMYLKEVFYTAGMVLISSHLSAAFDRATTAVGYQRLIDTFTTPATTATVRLEVVTQDAHTANAYFLTSGWQLEQKAHATSWHYGVGNAEGNTRTAENMILQMSSLCNGTSGTLQFIFSPFSIPQPYGAIFDWGEYDAGNAKDRICVLHGTSIGTSRRTIQVQVTNGATTTTIYATRVLTTASSQFNKYYVCVRWNLTGNIGTGYVKLDIRDMAHSETLTTTTTTAMTPISFASYPNSNFGHNHGGGNYENCIFTDVRFDTTALTDTEVAATIAALSSTVNNEFTITKAGAVRYPLDRDQMPTLYIPTGNVATQKGYFTFNRSIYIAELKLYNNNDAESVHATNGAYYTRFNFENNTFLSGSSIAGLTITMTYLTFDSVFFPLLTATEMTFYVTSDNDVSLEAFRKVIGVGNTFEYIPRYL
jgi:predicted phage tail component-like protein